MEARGTKKVTKIAFYQICFLCNEENVQLNLKNNYKIYIVWQQILVSKNDHEIIYGRLKITVATKTLFSFY